MIPNVLELILNNTIKVTPFDPTNHNNGYLKLTLADVGNVLAIPSETNYVSDPREIAFESTEDLPFKSVSIDSYALYPNRTIAVKSAETICLPDNIFGFVYAVLKIRMDNVNFVPRILHGVMWMVWGGIIYNN